MTKFFKKLVREESGATMVEYGLIVALIAVAAIVATTALGTSVADNFDTTSAAMGGAAQ